MGLPDSRMGPFSRLGGGWSDSSEGALSDSHRFTVTFSAWECPLCRLFELWMDWVCRLEILTYTFWKTLNCLACGLWFCICPLVHLPCDTIADVQNCKIADMQQPQSIPTPINPPHITGCISQCKLRHRTTAFCFGRLACFLVSENDDGDECVDGDEVVTSGVIIAQHMRHHKLWVATMAKPHSIIPMITRQGMSIRQGI